MGLNVVMAPSVAPIGSKLTINENGEYNVTDYAVADVNVSGGGGETWNTVFEGNVTTEEDGLISAGGIQTNISADTIKVIFNGTEYTCNRTGTHPDDMYRYGAPYSADNDEYDFSEYPFCIQEGLTQGTWSLITPTAGTYSLKIEEPQSGGESDFSTATVTLTNPPQAGSVEFESSAYISDGYLNGGGGAFSDTDPSLLFVLYKGQGYAFFPQKQNFTVTGDIEYDQEYGDMNIRGDGTITLNS